MERIIMFFVFDAVVAVLFFLIFTRKKKRIREKDLKKTEHKDVII